MDFANFASQPIIMEICKELRVEWQSVVFFGMNEKVGEGRRRERGGLRGGGAVVGVAVVWWCVVCGVLCVVVV